MLLAVAVCGLLALAACGEPDQPPIITGTVAGPSQATVSWQAPHRMNVGYQITGYQIEPVVAGVPQATQVFSGAATTQIVTGLTPGTGYQFRVRAVHDDGLYSLWSPLSATTTPLHAAAIAVTAGRDHTCALLTGGTIKCWAATATGR